MAGSFLAIGSCVSATTRNLVIAFVVTVVVCMAFLLAGFPPVVDFIRSWAPGPVVDVVSSFSFLTQFDAISRGVIDARSVVFFGSLIAVFLSASAVMVDLKKSA
jgi:ABC-2 type transport system permease protein